MCIQWFIEFKRDPKEGEISSSRTHTPDGIPIPNSSRSNWDILPGRSLAIGRTGFPVNKFIGCDVGLTGSCPPSSHFLHVVGTDPYGGPRQVWMSYIAPMCSKVSMFNTASATALFVNVVCYFSFDRKSCILCF